MVSVLDRDHYRENLVDEVRALATRVASLERGIEAIYNSLDYSLRTPGDVRVSGGIYAGAVDVDPVLGMVQATVGMSGWMPFTVYEGGCYNNASSPFRPYICTISRSVLLKTWYNAAYVATTNNGSNYWTIALWRADATPVATLDTSGISADTWDMLSDDDVDYSLTPVDYHVYTYISKTGSPGNIWLASPVIFAV